MAWRPSVMKRKSHPRNKRTTTKSVLRLPDLEHAKTAVLNSLSSRDAQRGYRHAINEFVDWYCSEPRLAFNRIVVFFLLQTIIPTAFRSQTGNPSIIGYGRVADNPSRVVASAETWRLLCVLTANLSSN